MISMEVWARQAWEVGGYHYHQIAKRCDVAASTVRGWKFKDNWNTKAKQVSDDARASVETLALDVDWTKRTYPQGAKGGEQLARIHGLRSKLFEGFSTNAKHVIFDTLNTTERDELHDLEAVSAISLGLITQWGEEIKRLEQQAKQVADNLESGIILTSVTNVHEEIEGLRAGRDERLKTTKTERQYIRINEAVSRLQLAISKETANFGKTQERIARIKAERAKLSQGMGESENASGLVDAMDRIASKLGSDADLED